MERAVDAMSYDPFSLFREMNDLTQRYLSCIIDQTPCPTNSDAKDITPDAIERLKKILQGVPKESGRSYFVYDIKTNLIAHESGFIGFAHIPSDDDDIANFLRTERAKGNGYAIFSLPTSEVKKASYSNEPVLTESFRQTEAGLKIDFGSHFSISVLTAPDLAENANTAEWAKFLLMDLPDTFALCAPIKGAGSNMALRDISAQRAAFFQGIAPEKNIVNGSLLSVNPVIGRFNVGSQISRAWSSRIASSSAFLVTASNIIEQDVSEISQLQQRWPVVTKQSAETIRDLLASGLMRTVRDDAGRIVATFYKQPLRSDLPLEHPDQVFKWGGVASDGTRNSKDLLLQTIKNETSLASSLGEIGIMKTVNPRLIEHARSFGWVSMDYGKFEAAYPELLKLYLKDSAYGKEEHDAAGYTFLLYLGRPYGPKAMRWEGIEPERSVRTISDILQATRTSQREGRTLLPYPWVFYLSASDSLGVLSKVKVEGQRVLTVTSSAEFAQIFVNNGARQVVLFDISIPALMMAELRMAASRTLSFSEYKAMFHGWRNADRPAPIFDPSFYGQVRSFISPQAQTYFDRLIRTEQLFLLTGGSDPFSGFARIRNNLTFFGDIITNEREYEHYQMAASQSGWQFKAGSYDEALNSYGRFDTVYLSNIYNSPQDAINSASTLISKGNGRVLFTCWKEFWDATNVVIPAGIDLQKLSDASSDSNYILLEVTKSR